MKIYDNSISKYDSNNSAERCSHKNTERAAIESCIRGRSNRETPPRRQIPEGRFLPNIKPPRATSQDRTPVNASNGEHGSTPIRLPDIQLYDETEIRQQDGSDDDRGSRKGVDSARRGRTQDRGNVPSAIPRERSAHFESPLQRGAQSNPSIPLS